jgi:multidrug transporter EmrE-like cation transporter
MMQYARDASKLKVDRRRAKAKPEPKSFIGNGMLPHLLLIAVLVLSVYSQLTMKWRALGNSSASNSSADHLQYLISMATDWRVVSAAGATFLAGVCWLLAIQRLDLGYAFPFLALTFVLITVATNLVLGEPLPIAQFVGLGLVLAGVRLSALAR